MFRGREQSRPELGYRLLQRLGGDVAEYGFVETSAKQDGRNMTMVLAPHRGAKTRARARHPEEAGAEPEHDVDETGDTAASPN
jgi:translation initiation factor IF-3